MRKPLLDVPLFPLPSLTLFPGRVLPLHVFEPRYRALMRDALKADARFAMAVLRPGWEPDYEGRPPIFETVTLGSITKYKELPDGRYMLHLLGESRARVVEEREGKAYRVGRVTLVEETPLDAEENSARLQELVRMVERACGAGAEGVASAIDLVDAATLALPVCIDKKMAIFSPGEHAARIATFQQALGEILERRESLQRAARLRPDDLHLN